MDCYLKKLVQLFQLLKLSFEKNRQQFIVVCSLPAENSFAIILIVLICKSILCMSEDTKS